MDLREEHSPMTRTEDTLQEQHQMRREHHKWEPLLAEAKLDHQQVLTLNAGATPPTQALSGA
jgi:hypothetical protein